MVLTTFVPWLLGIYYWEETELSAFESDLSLLRFDPEVVPDTAECLAAKEVKEQ
jgi:hypothetical protein